MVITPCTENFLYLFTSNFLPNLHVLIQRLNKLFCGELILMVLCQLHDTPLRLLFHSHLLKSFSGIQHGNSFFHTDQCKGFVRNVYAVEYVKVFLPKMLKGEISVICDIETSSKQCPWCIGSWNWKPLVVPWAAVMEWFWMKSYSTSRFSTKSGECTGTLSIKRNHLRGKSLSQIYFLTVGANNSVSHFISCYPYCYLPSTSLQAV